MFELQPVSTSNLFTLFQALIVLVGFLFSWKTLIAARTSINIAGENLKVATSSLDTAARNLQTATANAQVQLYNQMVVQGRDLQFKFMDLYFDENVNAKRDLFVGTVISYYSACFEFRRVFSMPESVIKLLDNELRELLRQGAVRHKFEEVKHMYTREFIRYVEDLRGV